MKRNAIAVDYEWTLERIALLHDFTGKDSLWVKAYINAWREGFLEGYILGKIESTISIVCNMKKHGETAKKIAEITDLSEGIIEKIDVKDNE